MLAVLRIHDQQEIERKWEKRVKAKRRKEKKEREKGFICTCLDMNS